MTTEPTRELVASLLRQSGGHYDMKLKWNEVDALCRAWLALHDAGTGKSLGMVVYHDDEKAAAKAEGQTVKVVRWPVEVGRG